MHQDNFRSAVYRSLTKTSPVLFQDGVGGVRHKTTARSKASTSSSSGMEAAVGRSHRRRDPVPFEFEEEGNAMMHRASNELQLSKVSEGAHSLTHMINDWFKEPTAASESAAFAQNLLRGALDLQESLVMLEKLRDSSRIAGGLNRGRKEECQMGNLHYEEDVSIQNLCSNHYEVVSTPPNRLQDMGLLADGSSRSFHEELKQNIKDSLYRQNLLSPSSDDERVSSSRSLRFSPSNRFDDKYNNHNAVDEYSDQSKKSKTPNLIAKLMGLDQETPSETFQTAAIDEQMKGSYLGKTGLNIERPKGRKVIEQNHDAKKKIDEIIQTMHLKGLLKRNKLEEEGIQPAFFISAELKQKYQKEFPRDGDYIAPPIVIMKPLHYARRDTEIHKEVVLDKSSMKEIIQLEKSMQEHNRLPEGAALTRKLHQREVDHMDGNKIASCSNGKSLASTLLKDQRDKISLAQKKPKTQPSRLIMTVKKQEEKVVKSMQTSTSNCRYATALSRPDKRLNQTRTYVDSQIRVPQNQLKSSRTDVYSPIRVPQNQLKSSPKPAQRASASSTKVKTASKAKAVQISTNANVMSHEGKSRQGKTVKPWNETSGASIANNSISSDNLFKQTKKTSPSYYKDNIRKDHRISCEVMPRINHAGAISRLPEEVTLLLDCRKNLDSVAESQNEITLLLLSSHSFILSAKEHFGFDLEHPRHENKITKKIGKQGAKLFLDLAEELMARKSYYHKDITRPLLQTFQSCRPKNLSSDQLVAEISNGIRKLSSCSRVDGSANENDLYMRLESDLSCTDVVINSVWDIGWANWICVEEAGKIVSDVGDNILSSLIEEVTFQLIY